MNNKAKRPPLLLIFFFLIAIGLVVFMMFVVQSNARVIGSPGKNVNLLNNLRYSFHLWRNLDELQESKDFDPMMEKKFVIGYDERAYQVCDRLSLEFQVSSAVCEYMIYKGYDRTLSPGTYTVPTGSTPIQMVDLISDNRNRDFQFTIFAGWRMEEIAALVDQLGFGFTGEQFLEQARNPSPDLLTQITMPEGLNLENKSLEGYFLPGSYSMKPSTTLQEFICEPVQKTMDEIQVVLESFDSAGSFYDIHQRMIIASIIQRETLDEAEMPLIASVFYNRLNIGMKLETDPTVQYGLGYDQASMSWWKTPLTYSDLESTSGYNTYYISGLPPGPISNPGKEAIFAAFHPDQSNYLFFRAKCDGSLTHNFAETYEEHLANGCN